MIRTHCYIVKFLVSLVGFCDPVIEEHFRRSLGKNYKDKLSSSSSSNSATKSPRSSSSSPEPADGNHDDDDKEVNITGSVDDHFAKALGEQWTNIKNNVVDAQRRSASSSSSSTPPTTPSPPPHSSSMRPAAQQQTPSLVPVRVNNNSSARKL